MSVEVDFDAYLDDIESIWGGEWTYESGWGWFAQGSSEQKFIESFNITLFKDESPIIILSQVPLFAGMNFTEELSNRICDYAYTNMLKYMKDNNTFEILEKTYGKDLPIFLTNIPYR